MPPTPRILSLGEVLWDLLPSGPVLGGAPANFAIHCHALGAHATLRSCIGDDRLGEDILDRLEDLGLPLELIRREAGMPTGTTDVAFDHEGQPQYTIKAPAAWDFLRADLDARNEAKRADAICFGSLAQRNQVSREGIRSLLAAASASALIVFDTNLRQDFYSREILEHALGAATLLKLNTEELDVLAGIFDLPGGPSAVMAQLAQNFSLRHVALTKGSAGSLLLSDGNWHEHPGIPVVLQDPIGAGDAFTAALVIALLSGWDAGRANGFANEVAAYVASQPGATPALPQALRERIRQSPPSAAVPPSVGPARIPEPRIPEASPACPIGSAPPPAFPA